MQSIIAGMPLIGMPGLTEWIVIVVIIVILFGATKLPKLGKGLGEGIRNFKKGIKGDPLEGENNSLTAPSEDTKSENSSE